MTLQWNTDSQDTLHNYTALHSGTYHRRLAPAGGVRCSRAPSRTRQDIEDNTALVVVCCLLLGACTTAVGCLCWLAASPWLR